MDNTICEMTWNRNKLDTGTVGSVVIKNTLVNMHTTIYYDSEYATGYLHFVPVSSLRSRDATSRLEATKSLLDPKICRSAASQSVRLWV